MASSVDNVHVRIEFMAQQASSSSSSVPTSGFEINAATDASWAKAAGGLPETVTINGVVYQTADLNENVRKLLAIYLADQAIVGHQKELLALAELGMKALLAEIESNLSGV